MRLRWVVLLIAMAHGAAMAQSKRLEGISPAAKKKLDAGMRYYNAQRYAEAAEELQAGYVIDPRPEFLYALGQAQRMGGNCRAAITAYKSFLGTGPSPSQAGAAETHITACT